METEKNYVQTKQKQNNRSIFSLLSFVWFPMKSTSVVVVVLLLLLSVFVVSASQGEEGSDQVDPNVGKDELSEEDIDAWEEMDDGDDEEEAKSEEDIVGCTGWEQYYSDRKACILLSQREPDYDLVISALLYKFLSRF